MMRSSLNGICCLCLAPEVTESLEQAVLDAAGKAEVCGLLGGIIQHSDLALATVVHPLSNISLQNTSFSVSLYEFCQQQKAIKNAGLIALATYHSHLSGSIRPSFRDVALPGITDLLLLILAHNANKMHVACYGDIAGTIVPIEVIGHQEL